MEHTPKSARSVEISHKAEIPETRKRFRVLWSFLTVVTLSALALAAVAAVIDGALEMARCASAL